MSSSGSTRTGPATTVHLLPALLAALTMLSGVLVAPATTAPARAADAEPPTARLVASPGALRVGESFRLDWEVAGADEVLASGAWSGSLPAVGSRAVDAREPGVHRYRISAASSAGAVLVEVEVEVLRRARALAVSAAPLALRGARTRVQVGGLAPREDYTVRLGSGVVAGGRADTDGRVDRRILLPRRGPEGPATLVVTGEARDRRGQASLQVVRPRRLPLRLASPEVEAGRDQTVTVRGLAHGEPVLLRHRGSVVARGTADRAGRFAATFDVGPDWGSTTVTVVGGFRARHGRATFAVVPRTADPRIEVR